MSWSETENSMVVVRGTISVAKWDRYDEIVQLQLEADDGAIYLLDMDPGIFDPIDFVDNYVEVSGNLKNVGKKRSIEVVSMTDFMRSNWEDEFDPLPDLEETAFDDGDLDYPHHIRGR